MGWISGKEIRERFGLLPSELFQALHGGDECRDERGFPINYVGGDTFRITDRIGGTSDDLPTANHRGLVEGLDGFFFQEDEALARWNGVGQAKQEPEQEPPAGTLRERIEAMRDRSTGKESEAFTVLLLRMDGLTVADTADEMTIPGKAWHGTTTKLGSLKRKVGRRVDKALSLAREAAAISEEEAEEMRRKYRPNQNLKE